MGLMNTLQPDVRRGLRLEAEAANAQSGGALDGQAVRVQALRAAVPLAGRRQGPRDDPRGPPVPVQTLPQESEDGRKLESAREVGTYSLINPFIHFRGVMSPVLDPDPESNFQIFGYSGSPSDPVKYTIVTPTEVL